MLRARAVTVVLLAVGLAAVLLPEAPVAAINGTPTVVVTPNSGLVDGQPVSVQVTDFPPGQEIGVVECPATATNQQTCGRMTPVLAFTDSSGAATVPYSVTRVIFTNALGRVDCAQTACVIGVGTAFFSPFVSATAPIGFVNTQLPPPSFSITLEGPHFLNTAAATIGARLTCDRAESIHVVAQLSQPPVPVGSGNLAARSFDYHCTAGADLHIFTDYLPGFQPGDAFVSVFLSVGGSPGTTVAAAVGTVTLQSDADTAAALQAALAGPDGDAVRAKLIDDLNWRITYNPGFRNVFYAAICCQ